MQKPLLPIQIAGASPVPARSKPNQPEGGLQFKQALKREVEQRKAPEAPPAKPGGPAKAQQPEKTGKPEAAPAKSAAKEAGKDGAAEDSAVQATAVMVQDPMVDMLALVASFNQPAASAATPVQAAVAELLASVAAPVVDEKLAAVVANAGLDQLAAAGAALLADGPVPDALPAKFSAVLARLDGKPDDAAPAILGDKTIGGQQAPVQDASLASRAAPSPQTQVPMETVQLNAGRTREAAVPEAAPRELALSAPLAAPVQQASQAMTQTAHGVGAGDKIAARVGTPGWDQQVGQKIVWMVAGKEQSASLTLNPPDMGPMQVVLNVTNDHATVTFSSATPEVRQALEDAMPKLREMMSESGIALGNASVNDGSAQQQQQAREDGAGRAKGAPNNTPSGSAVEAQAKAAARPARSGELPGLVDTFA